MDFQSPVQGGPPPLPSWQQPARKPGRWASWSGRKRALVVGSVVLAVLVVIGALAGPRRPTTPVAAVPTPSASPRNAASQTTSPSAAAPPSAAPSVAVTPSAITSPTAAPTQPPTAAPTPEPTPAPTTQPTPEPTPSEQFVEFYDGLWEVGVDFPPGTYRTTEYTFGCYWARLKNFSGELSAINANNFGDGYQVVTITSKDAGFESDDCGDWTSDLSRVTDSDIEIDEGTYIVGTDIRPGTYEADASEGCYWERVKGFKGTLGEIIANDFNDNGKSIVRIRASDAGFTTSGCGTWTLRS